MCTTFYKFVPDIKIKEPIKGQEAKDLKQLCPMGVFDIEDIGTAFVKDQRKCTTCRECLRHEPFASKIDLGKRKDVIEFHVESVGMFKPQDIVF